MKGIKIAFLAPYYPNLTSNSVMVFSKELVHNLSKRNDVELHWISLGKEDNQFKKGNLTIHLIKRRFFLPSTTIIPHIWYIKRKIFDINPDVVHVLIFPYSTVALTIQNRFPTLWTTLGIAQKEYKFMKGMKFIRFKLINVTNEKYLLPRIVNISVEGLSLGNLIRSIADAKIFVIPNGIDCKKLQQTRQNKEKIDVFVVASLSYIKGVDILIKAIPKVAKSFPNLDVFIAGSGPLEGKLKDLAKKLDINKHVKFLGFISDEEKYQYYTTCKIFIVPSRWDCMPTTLLEAIAYGKPVIASNVGGIPDVIINGKNGLLFESEDYEDLADKMIELLNDGQLRQKMGKVAFEKAKEYDWNKIAENTVSIYQQMIKDF